LVYVYWFMCTSLNRSIRLRIGPLPLGLAHQGQSKSIGCWYPLCSLLKLIFFRRVGPKWIYWLSIKLAVADGRNVIAFHPSSLTLFNSSYVCFFTLLLCWQWFRCNSIKSDEIQQFFNSCVLLFIHLKDTAVSFFQTPDNRLSRILKNIKSECWVKSFNQNHQNYFKRILQTITSQ